MVMLDKLQCIPIQICPFNCILCHLSILHFKFHFNLALKFYNLSCINNNFCSKFPNLEVKICYLLCQSSFNHYIHFIYVSGITYLTYDMGMLIKSEVIIINRGRN